MLQFAHDDNQQLRRLGNVRYITRGLVITVTSLYDYLRHNYRIPMFPLHIMVVNPLRYLYQRIQRRFPYSSDQLWHFTDNMVCISPPIFLIFSASCCWISWSMWHCQCFFVTYLFLILGNRYMLSWIRTYIICYYNC